MLSVKTLIVVVIALAQSAGGFALTDADGRMHTAAEWKESRAVVLLFIGAECPISNRYAPEIERLAADFGARRVAVYAVHSDPDLSAAAERRHAQEYGLKMPALLDPAQVLAGRLGVTLTPTAVVLEPSGAARYRGRIDDRYLDFGKDRLADVKPDLRRALEAVLDGKPVTEPVTKSIGCILPPPGKEKGSHVHPPR